jgi:ankyrin repeat protein
LRFVWRKEKQTQSCLSLTNVKTVILPKLKDPRVDPSDDDNTAIILASENGRIEVVSLLLEDERDYSEIKKMNFLIKILENTDNLQNE